MAPDMGAIFVNLQELNVKRSLLQPYQDQELNERSF